MATIDDYKTFLETIRKQTGLDMLVPDDDGLLSFRVDDKYNFTVFQGGVSMGVHESQSRFYENIIGRSRQMPMSPFTVTCLRVASSGRKRQVDILHWKKKATPSSTTTCSISTRRPPIRRTSSRRWRTSCSSSKSGPAASTAIWTTKHRTSRMTTSKRSPRNPQHLSSAHK